MARPRRVAPGRRRARRAAATRRSVGGRLAARAAGRGRAGRGVPAARRRLRGDVPDVLAGRCRGQGAGAAADGGGPHLRRVGAGGQARPDRRAVREATLDRPGRNGPAVLPRRHGQRPARRPYPGPAAAAARVLDSRRDSEPAARLRQRRSRFAGPRARLEHRVRQHHRDRLALRAAGFRDRPRRAVHACVRSPRRRARGRRAVRLARGADPRLRAGAYARRGGSALRPVRALRLGRGAHPAASTARTSTSSRASPTRSV